MNAEAAQPRSSGTAPSVSIVIATFNSELHIEQTVAEILDHTRGVELAAELLLVNDGSGDGTWGVLAGLAGEPEVIAIDLRQNHGQHVAQMIGIRHSSGSRVITMDDDMQHRAADIGLLLQAADRGHDLVVGRFRRSRYPLYRRVGSMLVARLNSWLFAKPKGFQVTAFRCIRRDLVERIVNDQDASHYLTGLALRHAFDPVNVDVTHRDRPIGKSTYTWRAMAALLGRILSHTPRWARIFGISGLVIGAIALGAAAFLTADKALAGESVNWALAGALIPIGLALVIVTSVAATWIGGIRNVHRPADERDPIAAILGTD